MLTHRFGRKIKLPSTRAIKHEILKLMLQDHLKALDTNATEGIDVEGRGVVVKGEYLRQSAPAAIPSG